MSAAIINSVGLFLDILGVILLFLFALPSRVSEEPRRWCMNRLDPSGELRAGFGEA